MVLTTTSTSHRGRPELDPARFDTEPGPSASSGRRLVGIAGDDRNVVHAKLGEPDDGGGRGTRPSPARRRGRPLPMPDPSAPFTPSTSVLSARHPVCDPHQRVGRADQFGARRCARRRTAAPRTCPASSPTHRPIQVRNLPPGWQFVGCALDALIGPVVQPQRPVCGEMQLRGPGMRDRRPEHRGLARTIARLSRTPLRLASSMFARCCW